MRRLIIGLMSVFMLVGCTAKSPQKPIEEVPKITQQIPFKLGEVVYELPLKYQTLQEDGWESTTYIDEVVLNPKSYADGFALRKDRQIIWVSYINPTESEIGIDDSYIAIIRAENRESYYDDPVAITIFDGLTFDSSLAAYEEQLGDGTVEENARHKIVTYNLSSQVHVIVRYVLGTETIDEIEIMSFKVKK